MQVAWSVKQHVTLEAHKDESSVAMNEYGVLWHARLGHVFINKIQQEIKACTGFSKVVAYDDIVCMRWMCTC